MLGHAGDRPVAAARDAPQVPLVRLQAGTRHRNPALPQDAGEDQRSTGGGVLEGGEREEAVRQSAAPDEVAGGTPQRFPSEGVGGANGTAALPAERLREMIQVCCR